VSRAVFFNLFAAAEPYINVNHSRNPMTRNDPWVQWRRQSEIFRVSGDRCPETMTTKQQAKNLFNFTILDII